MGLDWGPKWLNFRQGLGDTGALGTTLNFLEGRGTCLVLWHVVFMWIVSVLQRLVCAGGEATTQQCLLALRIKCHLLPRLKQPQYPSWPSPWTSLPRPRPHSPEIIPGKAYWVQISSSFWALLFPPFGLAISSSWHVTITFSFESSAWTTLSPGSLPWYGG